LEPLVPQIIECDVGAFATVRATAEDLAALRQKSANSLDRPLPVGLLKQADEQTIAGVAAVWRAIDRGGLAETSFADWAVLAAPRDFGRAAMADAVARFAAEGAWGLSPHLIPHRSLHALSGTLSQALPSHGPNFGVGGGPESAAEIFLAAAALLARDPPPGIWVVLTGGAPGPRPMCMAAALALVPVRASVSGLRFRVIPSAEGGSVMTLESLVLTLSNSPPLPTATWHLGGAARLEMGPAGAERSALSAA